jgi:hypothetical protein
VQVADGVPLPVRGPHLRPGVEGGRPVEEVHYGKIFLALINF